LISLGVVFSTAVAVVVFVLLGNMLMTNGRTGDVDVTSLSSNEIYSEFVDSDAYPDNSLYTSEVKFVEYKVPSDILVEVGGNATDYVSLTYRLE